MLHILCFALIVIFLVQFDENDETALQVGGQKAALNRNDTRLSNSFFLNLSLNYMECL